MQELDQIGGRRERIGNHAPVAAQEAGGDGACHQDAQQHRLGGRRRLLEVGQAREGRAMAQVARRSVSPSQRTAGAALPFPAPTDAQAPASRLIDQFLVARAGKSETQLWVHDASSTQGVGNLQQEYTG